MAVAIFLSTKSIVLYFQRSPSMRPHGSRQPRRRCQRRRRHRRLRRRRLYFSLRLCSSLALAFDFGDLR